MQNGSLEWHKKRRAAKTTSHFIRNQIEDYKSSQKWNNSTHLGKSPVFFLFFSLKDGYFGFFVSMLCCPATQQRSQFLCTSGLGLSCFVFSWAPPSPRTAYSPQRRLSTRAITSNCKTLSWIGRLARCGTNALGLGVRTTQRRTRAKPTGLLWFGKTGRMKLGMKYPHARYHRYQSKKSQTLSWLQKYLFVFL